MRVRNLILILGLLLVPATLLYALTMNPLNIVENPGRPGVQVDWNTDQDEWHLMRTVTASDTAFTTSTANWNYAVSRFLAISRNWNTVQVGVYATGDGAGGDDPTAGTFSWKIRVVRKWGPMQVVADGTWAIGGQLLSHDPSTGSLLSGTYAAGELPVISNDYWPTTVTASGTTDEWGTIAFDPLGAWGIFVEVTSLSDLTTLYIVIVGQ